MPWACHAKPAALGGATCGFVNVTGLRFNGLMCCESCGCTKAASDYRAHDQRVKLDRKVARSA